MRSPRFVSQNKVGVGDEDAGKYGVVERVGRDPAECECCCAIEHRVIEAEDMNARKASENPESVVELVEVLLEAALVLVQDVLAMLASSGVMLPAGVARGISFGSWLALRTDSLSCFSEANVGAGGSSRHSDSMLYSPTR